MAQFASEISQGCVIRSLVNLNNVDTLPKQELNLLKFSLRPDGIKRAQVRRKSRGARFLMSAHFAAAFTMCQMALAVIPLPHI